MSTSGYRSDDGASPPAREAESVPKDQPGLMEQVLRATLELTAEPTQPDWEALLAVAGRHRGANLSLEPVAREMIAALLAVHYSQVAAIAARLPAMSRELAATLLDDPPSRGRLVRLWNRLQESLP